VVQGISFYPLLHCQGQVIGELEEVGQELEENIQMFYSPISLRVEC
jgi:hypothetical protein